MLVFQLREDFEEGLAEAWAAVARFIPKFVAFLLILLIGWFVAKWLARLLEAILERVGFDRMVERGGVKRALARTPYDASDLLSKIVFYTIFLFVLTLAFGVFGPNPVSDLLEGIIAYLPKLFAAIVIIVVAAAIGAAVREIVDAALGALSYGRLLANVTGAAILVIGIFAALVQLEIAPEIITGLFYGLLAIVVGSAIVAIGGGGVVPMRAKWEEALRRLEADSARLQAEPSTVGERVEKRVQRRRAEAEEALSEDDETVERPRE